jgi:hypothetical protein
MFAVRAESPSTIRGSADNPVLLMVTFWPLTLLQIRAGSTRHPFRTTEPSPPLDAFCDPHAAITVEMKRIKTGKRRCI